MHVLTPCQQRPSYTCTHAWHRLFVRLSFAIRVAHAHCATECHARDEAAWPLAVLACDACRWGGCGAGDDLHGTDSVRFRAMGERNNCPTGVPHRKLRHSVFCSRTPGYFYHWINLHVQRHLPTSELFSVRRHRARVRWSVGRPRHCQRQDFASWQLNLVQHDTGRSNRV
jgi:hypothetical protein